MDFDSLPVELWLQIGAMSPWAWNLLTRASAAIAKHPQHPSIAKQIKILETRRHVAESHVEKLTIYTLCGRLHDPEDLYDDNGAPVPAVKCESFQYGSKRTGVFIYAHSGRPRSVSHLAGGISISQPAVQIVSSMDHIFFEYHIDTTGTVLLGRGEDIPTPDSMPHSAAIECSAIGDQLGYIYVHAETGEPASIKIYRADSPGYDKTRCYSLTGETVGRAVAHKNPEMVGELVKSVKKLSESAVRLVDFFSKYETTTPTWLGVVGIMSGPARAFMTTAMSL